MYLKYEIPFSWARTHSHIGMAHNIGCTFSVLSPAPWRSCNPLLTGCLPIYILPGHFRFLFSVSWPHWWAVSLHPLALMVQCACRSPASDFLSKSHLLHTACEDKENSNSVFYGVLFVLHPAILSYRYWGLYSPSLATGSSIHTSSKIKT